jgi:predicted short-subunit dehydrogenase-like oxidoreductase (DUF2520 family)
MDVSVVGAGRVGTAVAVLLRRAGHRITAVSGRSGSRGRAAQHLPDVPFLEPGPAAAAGQVVLLAVPDDLIATVARQIADAGGFWPGQWVAHLSGASPLAVLDPARDLSAGRLSIHPLQTIPDVEWAIARIPGSAFAVTADDDAGFILGERLAEDLGGDPFRLAEGDRALYHAAAVFASNYLVTVSGIAAALLSAAGVPDPVRAIVPLQRGTTDNVERLGPAHALTGPAVRGDAGTVELNLQALRQHAPDVVDAYVVMCRAALALAVRSARLTEDRRDAVEEVLARWT